MGGDVTSAPVHGFMRMGTGVGQALASCGEFRQYFDFVADGGKIFGGISRHTGDAKPFASVRVAALQADVTKAGSTAFLHKSPHL